MLVMRSNGLSPKGVEKQGRKSKTQKPRKKYLTEYRPRVYIFAPSFT